MSLAKSHRRRGGLAVAAVALAFLSALATAGSGSLERRVPLLSDWIGTQSGWHWVADGGQIRATTDGGRTWETIFSGGNFLFHPIARTSRNAGLVSTGRTAGATFWTNDGGRDWFPLSEIPLGAVAAGSGNGLYWHDSWGTLYRVDGWPPRGDFRCDEVPSEFGQPLAGHRFCREVDDGLRTVVAAQLADGRFDAAGGMLSIPPARGLPAGVVVPARDHPRPDVSIGWRAIVVVRGSGVVRERRLPAAPVRRGEEAGDETLFAAWPRLYAVAPLTSSPAAGLEEIGAVLWRSGNGGDRWAAYVARSLSRRAVQVPGRANLGARVPLPGGWVAVGRVGARPVVAIRQLDRTRPLLALQGSARCGALRPVVDWPHVVVEGRRGGVTRAVWLSSDGGYRWTAFGRC